VEEHSIQTLAQTDRIEKQEAYGESLSRHNKQMLYTGEKPFKPRNSHNSHLEALKMTDPEKEGAAKPQSDWDGDIIPRGFTIFLPQIKCLPT